MNWLSVTGYWWQVLIDIAWCIDGSKKRKLPLLKATFKIQKPVIKKFE